MLSMPETMVLLKTKWKNKLTEKEKKKSSAKIDIMIRQPKNPINLKLATPVLIKTNHTYMHALY